jgi:spore germination protein YaaH
VRRGFIDIRQILALAVLVGAIIAAGAFLQHEVLGRVAREVNALFSPVVGRGLEPAPVVFGAPHAAGLPTPLVLGYYEGGAGGAGYKTLEQDAHLLSGIVPDWYTIWANGAITGQPDERVLQYARDHDLWVFALVQQNQYGGQVLGPLLQSPVASRRAMESLLGLCETEGFDGINLDFEGVPPSDRQAYTSFVGQLADLLHRYGYYLTLSVPAETQDEPGNSWTGAYDYKALGKEADLVMVMAYDQHYAGGSAGPIDGTAWVQQVSNFAARTIPPRRVVLGIPLYGYDWGGSSTAQGLSFAAYRQLALQHGESPSAQDLVYWQDGVRHIAYYAGLTDFESKVRLASSYGLRGIVLWRLGLEDPSIWSYLTGP